MPSSEGISSYNFKFMREFFTVIGLLCILLSGCQKEDNAPTIPSDKQIEYKFSFDLDKSYLFSESESKIEEIALYLYDDKEQLLSSVYSNSSDITIKLSSKQKIAKALAVSNFSLNKDWGIFFSNDDKLEQIDLKEDINSNTNKLINWEKCTNLGFGTDKTTASLISSPVPMAGTAEWTSGEVHHISLTPLVAKVLIKNTSTSFPIIKEVIFDNVESFIPLVASDKNPISASTCQIQDIQPDMNDTNEISYYLPLGTKNVLSAILENASETSETLSYPINTNEKKEPIAISISEKQLVADISKIEFEADGGVKCFQLSSNLAWTAAFQHQLFSIDIAYGEGSRKLTVKAEPNESQMELKDTLTIIPTSGEGPVISIPVSQREKEIIIEEPDFTVSPTSNLIKVDAKSHTQKIIVTCRDKAIQPSISGGDTWFRVGILKDDTSNPLIKSFEITIFENTSGTERFGRVDIKTENMSYQLNILQTNKKEITPFTVELKYKGTVLGNEIKVPAKATSGSLEMKTSTGEFEDDGNLSLRAANGNAWVKIGNEYSTIKPDVIWHQRDACLLMFEENLGPERQMVGEFYSKDSGKVYHRVTFTQAAASDYINISSSSLTVDRYGNIYDEPFLLTVESNKEWEINCTDSWVKTKYTPNNRSQTLEITVEENKSEKARSTELEFVSNGKVVKRFPITQSINVNSTFNLKYELNLELTTSNNRFRGVLPTNQDIYYPDDVQIYNPGTSSNLDETIKTHSTAPYGFVADAPASYNTIVVNDIKSKLLIYPNYRGVASTQYNDGGITIGNLRYAQSFFRQIRYTLNIPAGVKRTQKVIYTIKIRDILYNTHGIPVITYSVVDQ